MKNWWRIWRNAMKQRRLRCSTPLAKRRRCLAKNAFKFGNRELALLLFETPSGFAIFSYLLDLIHDPNAMEVMWTYFSENWQSCQVVWLNEFRTIEDKSSAINQDTGVNESLAEMIKKWHSPGQKIAVGKLEYKKILEERLNIPCLYGQTVVELTWGIRKCMPISVPGEKSQLTEEDRLLPISKGLETFLGSYGCIVKPEMVNDEIIETAGVLFKCDSTVKKHSKALLSARGLIKDVSGINCEHWSLLKIARALKIIWWPEEAGNSCEIISEEEVSKLVSDKLLYESVLIKDHCLAIYSRLMYAHRVKTEEKERLKWLLEKAKGSYEAEQKQESSLRSSQLAETVASAD
uniref:Uncharacterized protein n=1 Tax=Avena sativa TaxID=4498 RepID=A0ACD6A1D8_AVESA